MSMRDEFEKHFQRPDGVFWDSHFGRYETNEMEFEPDADEYDLMWRVWQAARAQSGQGAEPVGYLHNRPERIPCFFETLDDARLSGCEVVPVYTQPQPATAHADGWVSMADREPTKSDEDCEGKIWLLWPNRRYFERVPRGHVSCAPEFYWKPTGLRRPQPPQEGE